MKNYKKKIMGMGMLVALFVGGVLSSCNFDLKEIIEESDFSEVLNLIGGELSFSKVPAPLQDIINESIDNSVHNSVHGEETGPTKPDKALTEYTKDDTMEYSKIMYGLGYQMLSVESVYYFILAGAILDNKTEVNLGKYREAGVNFAAASLGLSTKAVNSNVDHTFTDDLVVKFSNKRKLAATELASSHFTNFDEGYEVDLDILISGQSILYTGQGKDPNGNKARLYMNSKTKSSTLLINTDYININTKVRFQDIRALFIDRGSKFINVKYNSKRYGSKGITSDRYIEVGIKDSKAVSIKRIEPSTDNHQGLTDEESKMNIDRLDMSYSPEHGVRMVLSEKKGSAEAVSTEVYIDKDKKVHLADEMKTDDKTALANEHKANFGSEGEMVKELNRMEKNMDALSKDGPMHGMAPVHDEDVGEISIGNEKYPDRSHHGEDHSTTPPADNTNTGSGETETHSPSDGKTTDPRTGGHI